MKKEKEKDRRISVHSVDNENRFEKVPDERSSMKKHKKIHPLMNDPHLFDSKHNSEEKKRRIAYKEE